MGIGSVWFGNEWGCPDGGVVLGVWVEKVEKCERRNERAANNTTLSYLAILVILVRLGI